MFVDVTHRLTRLFEIPRAREIMTMISVDIKAHAPMVVRDFVKCRRPTKSMKPTISP